MGAELAVVISRPNIGSNVEVARPQTFNREAGKVLEFLTVCRLYIRMRMREVIIEEQSQWVLSYV